MGAVEFFQFAVKVFWFAVKIFQFAVKHLQFAVKWQATIYNSLLLISVKFLRRLGHEMAKL